MLLPDKIKSSNKDYNNCKYKNYFEVLSFNIIKNVLFKEVANFDFMITLKDIEISFTENNNQ